MTDVVRHRMRCPEQEKPNLQENTPGISSIITLITATIMIKFRRVCLFVCLACLGRRSNQLEFGSGLRSASLIV